MDEKGVKMIKLDRNLIQAYNQEAIREAADMRMARKSGAAGVVSLLVLVLTPVVLWIVQSM
jgi:hypothetical protein